MEKSNLIMCIPVDFGWNDIGSFNALEEVFDKDSDLNVTKDAYYVQVDSSKNIVISDDKTNLITSIGVSNMIIVQTKDALLICHKEETQKIKALLKKIG
jgi:mannose-1-phosphate guanylyltransferase